MTGGRRQSTGSFRIKGLATLQLDSEDAGLIHVPPALVRGLLNDEALCYRIAIDYATRICEEQRELTKFALDAQTRGLSDDEMRKELASRRSPKKKEGGTAYLYSAARPFSSPLFNDSSSPYYIDNGRRRVLSAEERAGLDVDALMRHIYPVIKEHLLKWDFKHIPRETLAEAARQEGKGLASAHMLDVFFPPDNPLHLVHMHKGKIVLGAFAPRT